jgi:hypothetical protein
VTGGARLCSAHSFICGSNFTANGNKARGAMRFCTGFSAHWKWIIRIHGCNPITVADDDWRARFIKAATPIGGATPTNTLEAMAGIARRRWVNANALYALFDEAYPQPEDGARRKAPFAPYLAYVPAWASPRTVTSGSQMARRTICCISPADG